MENYCIRIFELFVIFEVIGLCASNKQQELTFLKNPAPDGHSKYITIPNEVKDICTPRRCGVCPTYFQKICGFDFDTNSTFIFDNHCVMDLYNCIHGTDFINLNYENCIYFGNFAYVHGYKYEDYDYGEDHIIVRDTKKNPDFVK